MSHFAVCAARGAIALSACLTPLTAAWQDPPAGAARPAAPPAAAPTRAPATAPGAGVGATTVKVALGQAFTLQAGEYDLGALVGMAATVLGRNIVWQEQERVQTGKSNLIVTLDNPTKLTPESFEELLSNLLYSYGFAMAPLDAAKGFYEVLSLNGPRASDFMGRAAWRTPAEVLARPGHREWVLTTVRLRHVNAVMATNALRPFFAMQNGRSPQLTLGNVGNNEALVLAGFTDQVCTALRLLDECDQPPRQPLDPNTPEGAMILGPLAPQLRALQDRVAALEKAAASK